MSMERRGKMGRKCGDGDGRREGNYSSNLDRMRMTDG